MNWSNFEILLVVALVNRKIVSKFHNIKAHSNESSRTTTKHFFVKRKCVKFVLVNQTKHKTSLRGGYAVVSPSIFQHLVYLPTSL